MFTFKITATISRGQWVNIQESCEFSLDLNSGFEWRPEVNKHVENQ